MAGEIENAPPDKQQKELFESLISDPLILFQAVLDDPDHYENGVSDLLIEVINGRQSLDTLSRQDKDLLNRSVVDFATHTHTPRRREMQPAFQKVPPAVHAAMQETPEEELEIPTDVPTFWWSKAGAERSRTD